MREVRELIEAAKIVCNTPPNYTGAMSDALIPLRSAIYAAESALSSPVDVQCCVCGKKGLSTSEDGGTECELADGRWVCSQNCYDDAFQPPAPDVEAKLVAIVQWLEKHQPDVFSRGLWDAISALKPAEPTCKQSLQVPAEPECCVWTLRQGRQLTAVSPHDGVKRHYPVVLCKDCGKPIRLAGEVRK